MLNCLVYRPTTCHTVHFREVQHEQIERLDRRRDPISTGSYFIHGSVGGGGAGNSGGGGGGGGVPWMEHKDREPEQNRSVMNL